RTFRPVLVERLVGRFLSASARMTLRQLGRKPWRAALGITGISFSVAIVVTSGFIGDSIAEMVDIQFFRRARADATVLFRAPRAVHELERVPGVLRVEPVLAAPVRLSVGPSSRNTVVQGLPPAGQLHPLLDERFREITMPDEGVLLTRFLGEALGVGPGDVL